MLDAGDSIVIEVYDEPDLKKIVRIDKSGTISFPFVGEFTVIGLTTKDIENIIDKGLRGDYLIEPQVTVSMQNYRPFYIDGQVKRPGGYPYQEDITLDKAIALAGGLSSRASKSDWTILRTIDNQQVNIEANITTEIRPDDIIKIGQSFF
jgi:polysaccharide export outer membrane protein